MQTLTDTATNNRFVDSFVQTFEGSTSDGKVRQQTTRVLRKWG